MLLNIIKTTHKFLNKSWKEHFFICIWTHKKK